MVARTEAQAEELVRRAFATALTIAVEPAPDEVEREVISVYGKRRLDRLERANAQLGVPTMKELRLAQRRLARYVEFLESLSAEAARNVADWPPLDPVRAERIAKILWPRLNPMPKWPPQGGRHSP